MHQDGKIELDALAHFKPLKLISHQGRNVVKLFDSQYQTSSSVDDRLKPVCYSTASCCSKPAKATLQ